MGTSAASAPAPDPGRRTIRGLAASPVAVGAASVLVGLLVWQVGATLFFRPIVLPSVVDIASRAAELLASGDLLQHVQSSYLRILVGFLVGSLVGASLGMLMGTIVHVRRLLEPLVNFFRFVPPIAWLGVVLIWFGVGETSKILIIVYTTSFVVLLSTLAGVLAVPRNQVRAARCLGAGGLQVFRWVMLPASTRYVLTGMQIALTNSFATIVTAEMIAAETGLGHLILVSRNYMATDAIFVGIVTLGALGLLTSRAFATASRRGAWRFFLHG